MPFEPGQQLLHYRLIEKIGEGGMGVVWKAEDTTLDRDVALKLLPATLTQDPERIARFEREARTLASLQHPHVASVYGFEQSGEHRFLVMELVEGEDLAELIARGALPPEAAIRIAVQITRRLEAAHSKGLLHRDLIPANIKFDADGQVKVLDFGLAREIVAEPEADTLEHSPTITAAMTQAGTILGTAAYMSPEQARGKPVDARADIWAFGCILYEMLGGEQAFPGQTVSDVIAKILEREPDLGKLPAGIPPRRSSPRSAGRHHACSCGLRGWSSSPWPLRWASRSHDRSLFRLGSPASRSKHRPTPV
jgi:serine/threonine protein kinase